jgi:ABC-2 type transport system permease protein
MKTVFARRLRLARVLLSVTLAAFIEYRAEVFIWMIAGTLPLMMMFIWMGLAANGPVGGYAAVDFAAYFLLVFILRQFTVCWVAAVARDPARRDVGAADAPARSLLVVCRRSHDRLLMRMPIVPPVVLLGLIPRRLSSSCRLRPCRCSCWRWWGRGWIRFNMHYSLGLVAF